MLPVFSPEGGLPLIAARAASVAALLSVFGALVFRTVIAPPVLDGIPPALAVAIERRLLRATQLGIAVCLLALLTWLVLQGADMGGAGTIAQAVAIVPVLVRSTAFGHLMVGQFAVTLAAGVVLGRRPGRLRRVPALGLAALAVALQAGHSHAASMYAGPSLLLASDIVHLLSAGAWLGGLLPLLLLVRLAPPQAAHAAAHRFSPLGKLCVLALAASAAFQGWVLVASIPGLVGTAYGWMVLVKLVLFGLLLAFAVANQYRFAPALLKQRAAAAKQSLVRSIAAETGCGLAIIVAAAVLSSLPPAMHTQPLWPFPDRFTLDAVQGHPALRNEVLGALLALAGAALLLAVALLWRGLAPWIRWPAVAIAAALAWYATPHLDLLFVPAYPTSYDHSPTGFATTAIMQGAALFPKNCAMCHGTEGRGDGPAAKELRVPPADLTSAHLWKDSDGTLFWWLSHGIEAPQGGLAMPGFATILSDEERWDVIDYIRAHNAGLRFRSAGAWVPPIRAPGLQAECAGGHILPLAGFSGRFVRLVIGDGSPVAGVNAATVLATTDPAVRPAGELCIARDETLPRAYAIVAGTDLPELRGAEFLIDANGWLRAMQPAGTVPSWNEAQALSAEIRRLEAHPITASDHAPMQMRMEP